jgi:hypothetical protein
MISNGNSEPENSEPITEDSAHLVVSVGLRGSLVDMVSCYISARRQWLQKSISRDGACGCVSMGLGVRTYGCMYIANGQSRWAEQMGRADGQSRWAEQMGRSGAVQKLIRDAEEMQTKWSGTRDFPGRSGGVHAPAGRKRNQIFTDKIKHQYLQRSTTSK